MFLQYLSILIGLFSATISLVLGIISLRYLRQTRAVIFFSPLMFVFAIWQVASVVMSLSKGKEDTDFWAIIVFVALIITAPLFLAFVLQYTGHENWTSRKRLASLFVIPIISIVMICTNSFHHGMFSDIHYSMDGLLRYIDSIQYGWYFWIHTAYSFLLVFISIILIFQLGTRSNRLYRQQAISLMIGVISAVTVTIVSTLRLLPQYRNEFSPLGFILTGIAFFYSITRSQLLNIVPIARDMQIENMSDGMLVLNEAGQIVDINPAAEAILHVHSKEVISLTVEKALTDWHNVIDDYRKRGITQFEVPIDGEGETKVCDVRISRIINRRGRLIGHLVILRDITQRKNMEEELRISNEKLTAQLGEINKLHSLLQEQVIRDPLTGLYNRRYLNETLQHITDRTMRKQNPLSILMIDIDFFKEINDVYGHTAGDNVLVSLSEIFINNIRGCDMLYRYGGEEFLILMVDTPLETARRRAEMMRASIEEASFEIDKKCIHMTISIGVATFPVDGRDLWQVIDAADIALYEAKASGRNCIKCASERV
jgi:diguanylate cyclase (GGDEF)-like protein/PAS domain S-box-containing protein